MTLPAAHRRFAYHAWASALLVDAVTDAAAHAPARRPLAHALVADGVWLRRLRGESTAGTELWPALGAAALRELAAGSRAAFEAWLAPGPDLDIEAVYRNSSGTEYRTARADVLRHVLAHGAYHRGQAALELRRAGTAPPATDFIAWLRLGEPS